MHILFVTGEYPPMQGGVGAYTAELARALVGLGGQASILTSQQALPSAATASVPVYPLIDRWDWRIWREVPRWAAQVGAEWAHVQYQTAAFGMNPAINLAPWRWQRTHGLHVAWTYHDLLVPYLFPKAGHRLRRWVTHLPARACDLVVSTNRGDYEELVRGLDGSTTTPPSLTYIPIGSNITARTLLPTERTARRQMRGYRDEQFVIAYFGFLNRSKGGTTLVRTLHRLVETGLDARLLMIGERVGASDPTNFAYLQEVERLIGEFGLSGRVRWTGRQADEEVAADLNACDVLLMPYEDGASLRRGTLMAGLANGCAIVTTTPQAPLPELVHERDLLYVPPGDVAAMTRAVRLLAQDATLSARLQHGARTVSQQFTWETIAQAHSRLYLRQWLTADS